MANAMGTGIVTELRKFVAPEIIFGVDSRLLVGRYGENLNLRKVLLVTDPGVRAAGWADETIESLAENNVASVVFDDVSPNPRDLQVMAGARRYRDENCDAIVAVGGGSPMDCAKGIGIVASNGGDILEYEGVDRVPIPMPPLVCIPTTGGTSADVSQFAIITDTVRKVKIAIISKAVVPDLALVDPFVLTSMSAYLTACTGVDALTHAVEAYVSNASSALTDLHALEAIRLVKANLLRSIAEPENIDVRAGVMLASLQAGLAFSNASLGCVHALAHSLGGYLDLPHGECNALLLPFVTDFNFSVTPDRFCEIGDAIGVSTDGMAPRDKKGAITGAILELRERCGITGGLQSRGVNHDDIGTIARKAIKDPCNATNPRKPTEQDLDAILCEAM